MTEEQFRERIADIESYVNRTSFGCSPECPNDFYWHGELLVTFLTTLVEAQFYEELHPPLEYPICPCDLRERFNADAARFQEKWLCAA